METTYTISNGTPEIELIPLIQLKDHLKIDFDDDDDLLESMLESAIAAAENYMDLFIKKRDIVLSFDVFADEIPIPFGPIIGDPVIVYDPETGSEIDVSAKFKLHNIIGVGYMLKCIDPEGVPTDVKDVPGSVRISFSAGYEQSQGVPKPIKHGVLMITSDLYEYRTDRSEIYSTRAMALLRPYKKW